MNKARRAQLNALGESLDRWDADGFNVFVTLIPFPKTYGLVKARETIVSVLQDTAIDMIDRKHDHVIPIEKEVVSNENKNLES